MIVTKKAISRRTILRGVGATVALPLLDAMIPALTAQVKTAAKPIRRLGVVYHPNGVIYDKWLPTGTGANFELSPTLAGLQPFKDRLIVVTGLSMDQNGARKGPRPSVVEESASCARCERVGCLTAEESKGRRVSAHVSAVSAIDASPD